MPGCLVAHRNDYQYFMITIFPDHGSQLNCHDGYFMIADFGTADGGGFIKILPDLVGKVYFIYMGTPSSCHQRKLLIENVPCSHIAYNHSSELFE